MITDRRAGHPAPIPQQGDDYRASLLIEAGALLERVRQSISSLPTDTNSSRIETLMRDIHSYKSLVGFAKLDQIVQYVTDLEAYLALVYQGRVSLDATAVSLVDRAVTTLTLLHSASCVGDQVDCAAMVAEMHAALAAVGSTHHEPHDHGQRATVPRARTLAAQVDATKLAEIESLAATSHRLLRRLDDSNAFRRDEHIDIMRLALDNSLQRLQQVVHSCRYCQLRDLFAPVAARVIEMAPHYGKQLRVDLDVEPIDIELSLAQALRPAVTHVFRNAMAHGVEAADARVTAGKPREGVIAISAGRRGDKLVITIRDDGHGFDTEALKGAAISLGAISRERSASMSEDDIIALAYIPGMSTASTRTELSGTGMGLSSVVEDISSLGGSIRIASQAGRGASITLELPLPATG